APLRRRPQCGRQLRGAVAQQRDCRSRLSRAGARHRLPRLDHEPGGRRGVSDRVVHLAPGESPAGRYRQGTHPQGVHDLDDLARSAADGGRPALCPAADAGDRAGPAEARNPVTLGMTTTALESPAEGASPTPDADLRRRSHVDLIFRGLLTAAAVSIPVLLAFLVYELWIGSRLAIGEFGLGFIGSNEWNPVTGRFGALPLIFGTLVSSLLALVIAVPLSLGVAIFLTEFAPMRLRQPVAFVIGLLAAIPSVVYGLWGIFVLIPFLRSTLYPFLQGAFGFLPIFDGPIYGPSMLTAGIILAIMIMPYIMSVAREVLVAVPSSQREASPALAPVAPRWEAVRTVVLPAARTGRCGAIILGLGRALGETMAVTMVIGNRHEIASSLFAPGYTMAAAIANEFSEAVGDLHLSALAYVALVLFVVTVLVNAAARLLIWRVACGSGAGSRAL